MLGGMMACSLNDFKLPATEGLLSQNNKGGLYEFIPDEVRLQKQHYTDYAEKKKSS